METKPKQTPTEGKWEVKEVVDNGKILYWISNGKYFNDTTVCDLYSRERLDNTLVLTSFPNAKEHAEQIVREHNSHNELVEIAKDVLSFFVDNNISPNVGRDIARIKEILRKAEG